MNLSIILIMLLHATVSRAFRMGPNGHIQQQRWNTFKLSAETHAQSHADATPPPLINIVRLRGTVDTGYGRGGKKLGFPTANLPSSLFQDALDNIPTGVYFGWAVIEPSPQIHKAAVNVGYSPTFVGTENKQKIVEAHLITSDDDEPLQDFYGSVMRLALLGYLRPEQKFASFPDLMQAITNDVANAKAALQEEPHITFKSSDYFLTQTTTAWIGSNGGDSSASWEFEPMPKV